MKRRLTATCHLSCSMRVATRSITLSAAGAVSKMETPRTASSRHTFFTGSKR
jgi:hypothetical protein